MTVAAFLNDGILTTLDESVSAARGGAWQAAAGLVLRVVEQLPKGSFRRGELKGLAMKAGNGGVADSVKWEDLLKAWVAAVRADAASEAAADAEQAETALSEAAEAQGRGDFVRSAQLMVVASEFERDPVKRAGLLRAAADETRRAADLIELEILARKAGLRLTERGNDADDFREVGVVTLRALLFDVLEYGRRTV